MRRSLGVLRTCETTGLEQADHRHATMTSVKKAERTCTECGRDQKKKAAYNKRKSEYLVNKLREDHVMRIGKSTSFLLGEPEEPVGDGSEGSLQSWGAKVWRKWRQVREEFWKVKGGWCHLGWGVDGKRRPASAALGGTRGPERLADVRLR